MSSNNSDTDTPIRSTRTSRRINSTAESKKLSYKESDWNLPSSVLRTTRTRHGGKGRPNLSRKELFDSSSESEDESYETQASQDESDDLSEEQADQQTPENNKKPPATRVVLEVGSLTNMMGELCKCPECG